MPDDRKESTLFGEMRRMVRTSGAVGGIAARVAGQRFLGIKTDKAAHAEDLKQILGGLKGPLMKVAQFLSTVPDALPEEYAQELATLQSNAPPMGWAFVRRRMQGELGPAWQSRFTSFTQEAVAAASLGQVHRGTLPDGRDVACKLQYPDMPSIVEADLRQLKVALNLYRRMDSTLDNAEAYQELSARLREELDYEREASHMRLYGAMLANTPGVTVPVAVPELTTKRLLTMSWLEGRPILRRLEEDPPEEERNAYARALFRAWYVPFYRYGVIHGDPHLGNYQVREDAEVGHGVNLLDFGVIRIFPASFVTGVVMLYEAVRDDDREKAAHAYGVWGFRNLSKETMEVLNLWARFLYEPLVEDKVRSITPSDDPSYGRKIAQTVHEGLKRTGGVKIPREFPLMDRAAIGLGSVFFRLKAQANWHRLFMELVHDHSEEAVAQRQRDAVAAAGVPPSLVG
ncbi:AarF/ABC1/UbiB kinase family protein [Roseomonas frigidaquae]|uniref:AarF/ABC1/UbiB kinase family protein n=1 Tax=Falsiroseomonas frigidaquae TaxID=487318 RepID=A0ABX1F109_9PROT|nr:AarF/ABC1/UbiB kinase family protein [Falsiroseomonas frigidaquae]NKE45988.1 AarF/ABC1/UbiB kinase family protein [Falsiroseomonas frigidaquae]